MLLTAGAALVFLCSVKHSFCVNSEYYNASEASDLGMHISAYDSTECTGCPHESDEKGPIEHFTGPYPKAYKDETVEDDYHGIKIKDPYRWLENPHSPETQTFVLQQGNITYPYLHNHTDREEIKQKLINMSNYEKYSAPQRQNDNYFYFHNSGLQNHSVFYIQRNLTGTPEVFFDANKLSPDATTALKLYSFSEDGKKFAYCLSHAGSDWNTLQIKNVDTGENYPETLRHVKFPSIAWTHDHKGFFYNKYLKVDGERDGTETTISMGQKLFYHYLGTDQEKDVLVVEFPNPSLGIHADVSDCGRYLMISTTNNTQGSDLHYYDLHNLPEGKVAGKLPLNQIIGDMQNHNDYIANNGPEFFMRTNRNAHNGKIVAINITNPKEENWRTVVPENDTRILDGAMCVAQNKILTHYISNVRSVLELNDLNTGKYLGKFPLEVGQVSSLSGRRKYNEIYYTFSSYLDPGSIHHCNIPSNITAGEELNPTLFRQVKVPDFEPTMFQTKQVHYRSKDGTRIPMYIIQRVGLLKNSRNPVMIYGYGGYGISLLPSFSVSRCLFLKYFNGIYAIPNIRGGGEKGERWHNDGRLLKKQNCLDDFQAAAEYMIRKKYTKPKYLTIMGGSNGGLVTGACINQRPDLFGAALVLVGALDMLRFNQFTIAYYSESEFGSPKNKTHFFNLLSYSPLHNIRVPPNNTQYPAVLLMTADHDDRVPPLHSYKFAAALQEKIGSLPYQKKPLLLRVEARAGHGQGTPLAKSIEQMTDVYVFMMKTLGLPYLPHMP